nr:hypothetical protein [Tanacetum cinerariifolium]
MNTCTALSRRVEKLELNKIAQALEITKLKRRVKKLERRNKVKERMIAEMDQDVDVVLEAKEVTAYDKANQEEAKVDESVDIQGKKAESQVKIYKIDLDHANRVLSMQEDETEPAEVQEVVEVVTTAKLITKVLTVASTTITAAEVLVPAATTATAPTLTAAPRRRTKGVMIRDPEESTTTTSIIVHSEAKSKDKGKGILMECFKGMSYDDIRPIFEAKFNSNVAFLHKTKEKIEEEEESRALKRINETPAEKAAKRQKLDDEVEELKRHLQIVPNEDDDVYTEATPLTRKVPVVDYKIINLNNKPYYKIIRADDTHQLYIITFTTTQLILLVERKYPLTRFTLNQMLNVVRLEVKEESEVSLELLRQVKAAKANWCCQVKVKTVELRLLMKNVAAGTRLKKWLSI